MVDKIKIIVTIRYLCDSQPHLIRTHARTHAVLARPRPRPVLRHGCVELGAKAHAEHPTSAAELATRYIVPGTSVYDAAQKIQAAAQDDSSVGGRGARPAAGAH